MTPQQVHHVKSADGQQSLTIFPDEGAPIIVTGDHPQFEAILENAHEGDPEELRGLADATSAVTRYMQPLSERVSAQNGRVYFDGDELDTSLTQQIIRVLEDEGDAAPKLAALVSFLEKLYTNPSEAAREQLYDWLRSRPFGITHDGDLIGYKGVDSVIAEHYDDSELEQPAADFVSCWNGPGTVNGIQYDPDTGEGVPQSVGDIVELARSEVDPDSYVACSEGLHVGTFNFAESYGDTCLKVIVNPRDVVGVPTNVHSAQKIRVCRYIIHSLADTEDEQPVVGLS